MNSYTEVEDFVYLEAPRGKYKTYNQHTQTWALMYRFNSDMDITYNHNSGGDSRKFMYWINDSSVFRDEFKFELAKRNSKLWRTMYG